MMLRIPIIRCARTYSTIPSRYDLVKTKRSELKVGDIVGIKDIKLYKLSSIQDRPSVGASWRSLQDRQDRSTGYGESWRAFACDELDESLKIKSGGKSVDISIDGDEEFDKLVEAKWSVEMKKEIDGSNYKLG